MFFSSQPIEGEKGGITQSKRSFSKKRFVLALVSSTLCLAIVCTSVIFFTRPRPARAETPNQRPVLGINLTEPDFDSFTDAMKVSAPWQGSSGNAPVDANGWPTTDASVLVWAAHNNVDGTYLLSFNGQATLSHPGTNVQISNQQYNASTNTTTASIVIAPGDAYNFTLVFSDTHRTASSPTNTGVTNVQMFKPVSEGSTTSYDASTIFTPYVAQAVAPYAYIRIMFGTNWNKSVNWSDRTKVSDSSQYKVLPGENSYEGNQMAFEYMIKIANDNNKDLYVLVPDRANNDYITKMAQLFLYGSDGVNPYTSPQANPVWAPLKSNLKLYVEYTNEAWNFSFDQAHDLYDGPIGAQQEVANNPNSPLIFDGNTNGNVLWYRNYANRSLNVSRIYRSVFGDSAMMTRVRPLLYWQYNNLNSSAEVELQFLNDYYNNADGIQHVANPQPISYYFWGGGGAVYYNSNNDGATSVDALFASGIPQAGYQNILNNESEWARQYGLHFMAYEGSWGISGTVGDQARIDPRAKQTLIDSFNAFAAAGGENYTAGTFGQWDDIKTASSFPLVQAAAVINGSGFTPAAITQGIAVSDTNPTVIDGPHYSMSRAGLSGATTNLGSELGYTLRVSSSNSYQIAVNVGNSASGGKIGVYVDSVLLSTITVPNTGAGSSQSVVAGSTTLSPGLHGVLLRGAAQPGGGNAGTIYALIVQPGTGTPASVPPQGALPAGWQTQDVGPVGQSGYASYTNNTFSVTGSGFDITGATDAFRYVYQQVSGDTTIVARVTWAGDSNSYAKAGVMIRSSLNSNAANAMVYYSPVGDTTFEERTTDGGDTVHPTPQSRALPSWVKLVRTGNTITGFISPDGTNWTQVGSDTFNFPGTVYVGLVVCSHESSVLMTSDMDNVSLNGNAVPVTPTVTPTSTPTPNSGIAINAGGAAAGSFVADTGFSGGNSYTTNAAIDTSGVTGAAPQAVYQTERYGNFTYTLPNLSAGASYTVRLHFAELYWSSAGQRVFNVSINGTQALSNFDIVAAAGAANKAVIQTFTTNASGNGQIVLQFSTVTDNAKVDGIEIVAGGSGSALFSTGFEGSDPPPTWTDSVDNAGYPAGGSSNVAGICCGLTGPEASLRTERAHGGTTALMYSGSDISTSNSYAYVRIFDLSSKNITVSSGTTLEYWIFPQSSASVNLVSGSNSTCVAIDLIFSNGSNLRDSGAVDQNGNAAHPNSQCNKLTLDTWNHVVINLGAHSNGLTIVRLDLGYDQPANTGGYRGYVDDISIHN